MSGVDFLFWDMSWWSLLLVMLATTQFTILSITLYLHRSQSHLALTFHPVLNHIFRLWLWLTTGAVTSEWVAIHRKHHAKCETADDPHSPVVKGFSTVMWSGAELYRAEAKNADTLEKYSHCTPNDWLENKLYKPYSGLGITLSFIIFVGLFGPIGITMWAIQMAWMPLHAAGFINAAGHGWGYRNWECKDAATNIVPWGIWIGGEELHNNHHAFPSSAKLSAKPWEFDIGWMWICILRFFRLAEVKRTIPQPMVDAGKTQLDAEAVKAILRTKMHVMADYANEVIKPVLKEERQQVEARVGKVLRKAKRPLIRDQARLSSKAESRLAAALDSSDTIKVVYEYRERLMTIWSQRYSHHDGLLTAMQEWVQQAEQSGIDALQEFADSLKGWRLNPV